MLSNGQAIRSCITPVSSVTSAEITTLEGLGTPETPHPLQQAFIDEQASQCGFCLSGVMLTAKAFLDRNPRATDEQIQQALSGVLCRCFGNVRMLRAIRRYANGAPRMRSLLTSDARRRAGTRGLLAPIVPERLGRGHRHVCVSGAHRPGHRRARARHQRSRKRPARFVDRHRQRRHRHGLHRQVRVRPGPLHRADAARRRRDERAVRARAPDSVRHLDDAGSGNDLRPAVASGELQSRQPGAGRSHRARDAGAPGLGASRRGAVRISSRRMARSACGPTPSRRVTYGALVGGRRLRGPARSQGARASTRASGRCSARPCRAWTCAPW